MLLGGYRYCYAPPADPTTTYRAQLTTASLPEHILYSLDEVSRR